MCRDCTCHSRAVRVRRLIVGGGIETGGDRAGKIGMRGVDLGVDDGNQNSVTAGQAVSFRKIDLLRRILIGGNGNLLGQSWSVRPVRAKVTLSRRVMS